MSQIYNWLLGRPTVQVDAHETDPALLRDFSSLKTYTTSRFRYRDIRVFFRQHAKAEQLPQKPTPLPLLVCIPGLSGSVAQFYPLLKSLVDMAPCLAIDHPGGGRSSYSQTSWDAYTMEALVELLEAIIEDHRDKAAGQEVVLIGHSMGTGLSVRLASKTTVHTTDLANHIVGLIAICPLSGPPNETASLWVHRLLWIPVWIFSLWRIWDSRGGPNSLSITRFAGKGASPELRLMQYRFNKQSRSPVFLRMLGAAVPWYKNGKPQGGLPTTDIWSQLDIPLYLIGGEADHVTPTTNADKIINAIKMRQAAKAGDKTPVAHVSKVAEAVGARLQPDDHDMSSSSSLVEITEQDFAAPKSDAGTEDSHNAPSTPMDSSIATIPPRPDQSAPVVQSIILPAPANHTLLYAPRSSRILAGLIADFLASHVSGRLSLAWQLQYLSQEGKWDVKNLAKWQSVVPVSAPIGPVGGAPVFRAMKTLREVDEVHSPAVFTAQWRHSIKDVVDISRDQPVYDAQGLERAGVHYHKFPTVSKVPPSGEEVAAFIELVDSIRARQADRAVAEGWDERDHVIGVHCHYGYNRTGYFLVCYLVERCGVSVHDAISMFKEAKPNGIRHSHFLDKLYLRYDLGRGRRGEGGGEGGGGSMMS